MITEPIEVLGEATELAIRMVDQIEWVDIYEPELSGIMQQPIRQGQKFTKDITDWIKRPRTRDQLKRVIDALSKRIRGNAWALKCVNCEEMEAAAELVCDAIRGLIRARCPENAWVLRRRLMIMFRTVEVPWIQDPLAPASVQEKARAAIAGLTAPALPPPLPSPDAL